MVAIIKNQGLLKEARKRPVKVLPWLIRLLPLVPSLAAYGLWARAGSINYFLVRPLKKIFITLVILYVFNCVNFSFENIDSLVQISNDYYPQLSIKTGCWPFECCGHFNISNTPVSFLFISIIYSILSYILTSCIYIFKQPVSNIVFWIFLILEYCNNAQLPFIIFKKIIHLQFLKLQKMGKFGIIDWVFNYNKSCS